MHIVRLGRVGIFWRVLEWRRKHRASGSLNIEIAQVASARPSRYVGHGGIKGYETACGAAIIKRDVLQCPCDQYGMRGKAYEPKDHCKQNHSNMGSHLPCLSSS